MSQISQLQILKPTRVSTGMVEENNMMRLLQSQPFEMGSIISSALATQENKSLLDFLTDKIGSISKKEITNGKYRWDLHLDMDYRFSIAKVMDATNATPGIANTEFQIAFHEDVFKVNDVLLSDDDKYEVRVTKDSYQDGNCFVYSVELWSKQYNFFPVALLQTGATFLRVYTAVGEYSDKGGSPIIGSAVKMENHISKLRLSYEITDDVATNVMTFGLVGNMNNPTETTKLWTKVADWAAIKQWNFDKNYAMLTSRYMSSADSVLGVQGRINSKDENGRLITMGSGLEEQLGSANTFYHNGALTYKSLEKWFRDLSLQCTTYGGDTDFVLLAGDGLFDLITNAVNTEYKAAIGTYVTNDANFFLKGDNQNLEFKSREFTTIIFKNGITVKVGRFKPYNSKRFYPAQFRGYSKKSYEGLIMNIGKVGGSSNLQKVYKKGNEDKIGYVAGFSNPFMTSFNGGSSSSMANGKDAYTWHFMTKEGIMVKDPSGCARIQLQA